MGWRPRASGSGSRSASGSSTALGRSCTTRLRCRSTCSAAEEWPTSNPYGGVLNDVQRHAAGNHREQHPVVSKRARKCPSGHLPGEAVKGLADAAAAPVDVPESRVLLSCWSCASLKGGLSVFTVTLAAHGPA